MLCCELGAGNTVSWVNFRGATYRNLEGSVKVKIWENDV